MLREGCAALEIITKEFPLAIALEDLHWADPSTLDLIAAIARRKDRARLLLLSTYRPGDVPANNRRCSRCSRRSGSTAAPRK